MPRFVISPHFRLQEWVAEEKGYFAAEGLDYEFRESIGTRDAKRQNLGNRVGAYQTIERGRQCDVSAACHWTINVAASMFEESFRWIAERGIFPEGEMGSGDYEAAVVSLTG